MMNRPPPPPSSSRITVPNPLNGAPKERTRRLSSRELMAQHQDESAWPSGQHQTNPSFGHRRMASQADALVTCRFCNAKGKASTMIVPCACDEEANRHIHKSCLNIQRWTDPNPAAFKSCTVCDVDYVMTLREGAHVESGTRARLVRVVCADSFFLIMALLTGVAISTGIVERCDSCFTAPGGCGEHCKGCCNVPVGANASVGCPKGGYLLNAFGLKDTDSVGEDDGGFQYKTTYFMLGSVFFIMSMAIVGTMDVCCVVKDGPGPPTDDEDEDEDEGDIDPNQVDQQHRAGGDGGGDTNMYGDTKISFLMYVYCCMCASGNAMKGFKACRHDICVKRECIWCDALKPSSGSNDIGASIFFFLFTLFLTIVVFATIGVVVGIVILSKAW
jgi:hypothetical protein